MCTYAPEQLGGIMRGLYRATVVGTAIAAMTLLGACSPSTKASDSYSGSSVVKASDSSPASLGRWDTLNLPKDMKINAIHSVVLATGDVLLIAGSGNDTKLFAAGTFKTLLYSPKTGKTQLIHTPEDLFCGGHAQLPNGNVLVAGGTAGYEVAPSQLKYAGGVLTLVNETPQKAFTIPKGSKVKGDASGRIFVTDRDITIPKAVATRAGKVTPSQRNVYVSAVIKGKSGIVKPDSYHVVGKTGDDALNLHGYAQKLAFEKKNYEGITSAYEFNPWKKEYIKVDPMNYARWYPTLTEMSDGHIMAISGLDGAGKILDGQIEIYDPKTHAWTERPDLTRMFPTYPSVFQTAKAGLLFSAGINQGYGPAKAGRDPGFWNLNNNSFIKVHGYRDPGLNETGAVAWLGPVNDQRMVVVGGGSIGDTPKSTGRIDMIDMYAKRPGFKPFANLPQGTRYPSLVTLPTGDMFITNGSVGYRGRHKSDIRKSYMLSQTGKLTEMARPAVGRDYHSTALLLPNGQILVAGSDPLFADKNDTKPGKFDQRIEIYTPPYLLNKDGSMKKDRPVIESITPSVGYGRTITLKVKSNASISKVRLLFPGAVTHSTDTNQRLVELKFTKTKGGSIRATIPDNPALMPPAHYMAVVIDSHGVPSPAAWVAVSKTSDSKIAPDGMDGM